MGYRITKRTGYRIRNMECGVSSTEYFYLFAKTAYNLLTSADIGQRELSTKKLTAEAEPRRRKWVYAGIRYQTPTSRINNETGSTPLHIV
ncbi:hypothetical protein K0M31_018945 [Melipona bicolor]|uniref:Uncharacterized protein n=1 Tax=Melipona bicolor TaxID=60889 RepID=A0AA40FCN7_9HYME|nr:hypothetical protein K0M31_018945 [Melipona bicolor]